MKHLVNGIIAILLCNLSISAQNFTWMKGSNQISQAGVYGSIGVPGGPNTPGARQGQASWRDGFGEFWLFGGEGFDFISNDGLMNDLWKYVPTTNQWAWIKGDNVISQVGVYGTQGSSSLGNKPGSRTDAMTWVDLNGNLWLFGGYGWDGGSSLGYLNDLWKYNPGNNEWTWINGSNTTYPSANYGTIGVPANSNMPGPRRAGATWVDASGNFYLFGGYGTATAVAIGSLNDVWQYNITTNNWTWINGSSSIDQNGTYGTLNTAAPTNQPGGRAYSAVWKDASGAVWLLGGDGFDATVPLKSYLNDLWKYNVITNEWTWKGGSNSITQNGIYGVQGVGSTSNKPGARMGPVTWTDAVGNLWLMGGNGLIASGSTVGALNDLWKYNIATGEWMWVRGTSLQDQSGTFGTQTVPNFNNRPGGRNSASAWTDNNNNLFLFGGKGYAAGTGADRVNDLWRYPNCFISPISLTITARDLSICAGESTSLTATGSNNYVWSQNSSTLASIVISPSQNTTYSVSTTTTNNCTYTSAYTQTVNACQSILQNSNESKFEIFPIPASESVFFKVPNDYLGAELIIKNIDGQIIYRKTIAGTTEEVKLNFAKGIYFYAIDSGGRTLKSGKLLHE